MTDKKAILESATPVPEEEFVGKKTSKSAELEAAQPVPKEEIAIKQVEDEYQQGMSPEMIEEMQAREADVYGSIAPAPKDEVITPDDTFHVIHQARKNAATFGERLWLSVYGAIKETLHDPTRALDFASHAKEAYKVLFTDIDEEKLAKASYETAHPTLVSKIARNVTDAFTLSSTPPEVSIRQDEWKRSRTSEYASQEDKMESAFDSALMITSTLTRDALLTYVTGGAAAWAKATSVGSKFIPAFTPATSFVVSQSMSSGMSVRNSLDSYNNYAGIDNLDPAVAGTITFATSLASGLLVNSAFKKLSLGMFGADSPLNPNNTSFAGKIAMSQRMLNAGLMSAEGGTDFVVQTAMEHYARKISGLPENVVTGTDLFMSMLLPGMLGMGHNVSLLKTPGGFEKVKENVKQNIGLIDADGNQKIKEHGATPKGAADAGLDFMFQKLEKMYKITMPLDNNLEAVLEKAMTKPDGTKHAAYAHDFIDAYTREIFENRLSADFHSRIQKSTFDYAFNKEKQRATGEGAEITDKQAVSNANKAVEKNQTQLFFESVLEKNDANSPSFIADAKAHIDSLGIETIATKEAFIDAVKHGVEKLAKLTELEKAHSREKIAKYPELGEIEARETLAGDMAKEFDSLLKQSWRYEAMSVIHSKMERVFNSVLGDQPLDLVAAAPNRRLTSEQYQHMVSPYIRLGEKVRKATVATIKDSDKHYSQEHSFLRTLAKQMDDASKKIAHLEVGHHRSLVDNMFDAFDNLYDHSIDMNSKDVIRETKDVLFKSAVQYHNLVYRFSEFGKDISKEIKNRKLDTNKMRLYSVKVRDSVKIGKDMGIETADVNGKIFKYSKILANEVGATAEEVYYAHKLTNFYNMAKEDVFAATESRLPSMLKEKIFDDSRWSIDAISGDISNGYMPGVWNKKGMDFLGEAYNKDVKKNPIRNLASGIETAMQNIDMRVSIGEEMSTYLYSLARHNFLKSITDKSMGKMKMMLLGFDRTKEGKPIAEAASAKDLLKAEPHNMIAKYTWDIEKHIEDIFSPQTLFTKDTIPSRVGNVLDTTLAFLGGQMAGLYVSRVNVRFAPVNIIQAAQTMTDHASFKKILQNAPEAYRGYVEYVYKFYNDPMKYFSNLEKRGITESNLMLTDFAEFMKETSPISTMKYMRSHVSGRVNDIMVARNINTSDSKVVGRMLNIIDTAADHHEKLMDFLGATTDGSEKQSRYLAYSASYTRALQVLHNNLWKTKSAEHSVSKYQTVLNDLGIGYIFKGTGRDSILEALEESMLEYKNSGDIQSFRNFAKIYAGEFTRKGTFDYNIYAHSTMENMARKFSKSSYLLTTFMSWSLKNVNNFTRMHTAPLRGDWRGTMRLAAYWATAYALSGMADNYTPDTKVAKFLKYSLVDRAPVGSSYTDYLGRIIRPQTFAAVPLDFVYQTGKGIYESLIDEDIAAANSFDAAYQYVNPFKISGIPTSKDEIESELASFELGRRDFNIDVKIWKEDARKYLQHLLDLKKAADAGVDWAKYEYQRNAETYILSKEEAYKRYLESKKTKDVENKK